MVRKVAGHNKYECKNSHTGRVIVRDIGDMRERSSRKTLLEKWKLSEVQTFPARANGAGGPSGGTDSGDTGPVAHQSEQG